MVKPTPLPAGWTGSSVPASFDDRQVCSVQDFTPKFDHSKWDNFELFFPYSAFPFKQAGRYDLKFYVQYYVKADGAKLGRTDYRVLTYTHR